MEAYQAAGSVALDVGWDVVQVVDELWVHIDAIIGGFSESLASSAEGLPGLGEIIQAREELDALVDCVRDGELAQKSDNRSACRKKITVTTRYLKRARTAARSTCGRCRGTSKHYIRAAVRWENL